jgi:uncharacterized RDD family membrane protein YckC
MKPHVLQIRTPEGIVFSQLLAGPVPRFAAWLVDLICLLAGFGLLGYLLVLAAFLGPNVLGMISTLAYFVLSIGYGIVCEWIWRGQTVGKRMFRLRVVDAEGLRLQPSQIVIRNLLRFVDSLPLFYFVGGVWCWFSPKSQRLGDLAANTVVIRHPVIRQPDLDQLLAGKFNSLRQHPHLVARLRARVQPGEAALALHGLLRREEFEPAARIQLYADLAAHFRRQVEFPAEVVDSITDEQYLRNVVDVLYRTEKSPRPEAH